MTLIEVLFVLFFILVGVLLFFYLMFFFIDDYPSRADTKKQFILQLVIPFYWWYIDWKESIISFIKNLKYKWNSM